MTVIIEILYGRA